MEEISLEQNHQEHFEFDVGTEHNATKILVTYYPSESNPYSETVINASSAGIVYESVKDFNSEGAYTNKTTNENDVKSGKANNHNCFKCGKSFKFQSRLKIHLKKHEDLSCFECPQCCLPFTSEEDLFDHQKTHAGNDRPYECCDCGKKFLKRNTMLSHRKTHSGIKPFNCNICRKRFLRKIDLTIHERTHSGVKPFECRFCNKSFATSGNLIVHERLHQGVKPYTCMKCSKTFTTIFSLKRHMARRHSEAKILKCEFCDRMFENESHRTLHTDRVHLKIAPVFECPWCQKTFVRKNDLTTHKRIHSGEKPYICQYCNRAFTTSSSLYLHVKIHSNEKNYQCATCGKTFLRPGTLALHVRMHSGEKPYSCRFCEKVFARRGTLVYHEKTHTGLKPAQCLKCGKFLCSRGYLVRHEQNCAGKPFKFLSNEEEKEKSKINRKKITYQCMKCGIHSKNQSGLDYHQKHGCAGLCETTPVKVQETTFIKTENGIGNQGLNNCVKCGIILQNKNEVDYHNIFCSTLQQVAAIESGKETFLTNLKSDSGEYMIFVSESCPSDLGANQVVLELTESGLVSNTNQHTAHTSKKVASGRRKIKHRLVVNDVNSLTCHHCGKVFSAPSRLLTHSRIHTGHRPFKCSMCSKCFNQKGHLATHILKRHRPTKGDRSSVKMPAP